MTGWDKSGAITQRSSSKRLSWKILKIYEKKTYDGMFSWEIYKIFRATISQNTFGSLPLISISYYNWLGSNTCNNKLDAGKNKDLYNFPKILKYMFITQ